METPTSYIFDFLDNFAILPLCISNNSSEMTDTGIEPVDKITTRPLDQPKDKLGYDQENLIIGFFFKKFYVIIKRITPIRLNRIIRKLI